MCIKLTLLCVEEYERKVCIHYSFHLLIEENKLYFTKVFGSLTLERPTPVISTFGHNWLLYM